MAKMASMYDRGIRNLFDYSEGRKDGREDVRQLLESSMKNPATASLPARAVLQILLASLVWEEDDADSDK